MVGGSKYCRGTMRCLVHPLQLVTTGSTSCTVKGSTKVSAVNESFSRGRAPKDSDLYSDTQAKSKQRGKPQASRQARGCGCHTMVVVASWYTAAGGSTSRKYRLAAKSHHTLDIAHQRKSVNKKEPLSQVALACTYKHGEGIMGDTRAWQTWTKDNYEANKVLPMCATATAAAAL
ncbi:hypothetical protein BJ170DRAFT_723969 [Xylariales sp. AK1849]|nr:hypothetical protein BJ170DRAFT_723969 [Xylariales sp. AK1849]